MKSNIFRFFSTVLLALSIAQLAQAADVVVISHQGTNISAGDVRDIFLGEIQFAGRTKLAPIDNAALQDSFLSKHMQMDAAKYNGIWIKKSFREGLVPPAVRPSDAEVISFVKRTPGAISYVSRAPEGVNVVR